MRVATFRVDVTPPVGAPLCGGMVSPVKAVADPLYAIGVILLGDGLPIVLCAVDWCEINNLTHIEWRAALAEAAGTPPERVALHSVHQHNAPIADRGAEALVRAAGMTPFTDLGHLEDCVLRTARAAAEALAGARRVTHVGFGHAVAREVASARRILGGDGRVSRTRWSSAPELELREAPEGLVDPHLRTITFLDASEPVVSLHYYATHPMSYYGDGVVTADFAGLARERRRAETPGQEHVYFNGCAGDITAGKYNEGTPQSRERLTGRMHRALAESEEEARERVVPVADPVWVWRDLHLPQRSDRDRAAWEAVLRDPARRESDRRGAAQRLAYILRSAYPCAVSRLEPADGVRVLHLPGEPFVEYQLAAASRGPFVAVAGYGDTGAGYLPLARSFTEGGYEPEASGVSADVENALERAMTALEEG